MFRRTHLFSPWARSCWSAHHGSGGVLQTRCSGAAFAAGRSRLLAGLHRPPPALDDLLPRAGESELAGWYLAGDGGAGANGGARADRYRRHQHAVGAGMNIIPQHAAVFVRTVVVGNDGAGADVDALAQLAVTDVGEMIGLGVIAQTGVFYLDEMSDVHAACPPRPGTQAGEWPDEAARGHGRGIDYAMREHLGAGANLAVTNDTTGAHAHAVAEHDPAFEHDVHVQEYVHAMADRAAHVKTRGIRHRDAAEHQRVRGLLAPGGLKIAKLRLVVYPQHLGQCRRDERPHRDLVLHRHGDDIREVVLALRVGVTEAREPLASQGGGSCQHTGIALGERALAGVRVLVLDDAHYLSFGSAHDAAVAAGVLSAHGEQAYGPRACQGEQLCDGGAADERHVAVQHQQQLIIGDLRHRLHERMPGSQTRLLQDPGNALIVQGAAHLFPAMPVDHVNRDRLERARGVDDVLQERPAGERLQHFREGRLPTLAFTRRGDHDSRRDRLR